MPGRSSGVRAAAGSSRPLSSIGAGAPDWLNRRFKQLAHQAGLPDGIRVYDLRHGWAALRAGVHPKLVQEVMRHSSYSTTADTYPHVMPAHSAEAVRTVAALLRGAMAPDDRVLAVRERRRRLDSLPNPKVGTAGAALDSWYRYYAGYSAEFVEHVLAGIAVDGIVVDSWNGAGTTTVMAARSARAARGFDVNPALVVVANARLLGNTVAASINALTSDIVQHASPVETANDPLLFWFDPPSAAQVRGLQTSMHRLLVASDDSGASPVEAVDGMSSLAAFFYVALFRTVRVLAAPAAGTNPTWWKKPAEGDALSPGPEAVIATFRLAAQELLSGLHGARFNGPVRVSVHTGDSRRLPLNDGSAGAAVTSPPYCTRIDYAIATRPELAVLRADEQALRALRDRMVGTPTMTGERGSPTQWGEKATEFLRRVREHPTRASSTYYLHYFEQYYAAMWDSLGELRRVCRDGAPAVLVVQDSHYKDVHNDTPGILLEMAALRGFSASGERYDFVIPRTKAAMNPRARAHRASSSAVESVLVLQ